MVGGLRVARDAAKLSRDRDALAKEPWVREQIGSAGYQPFDEDLEWLGANLTLAGRLMVSASDASAQTALLGEFTDGLKGLVPASGGGSSNFLRADGTWAAPPTGVVDFVFGQLSGSYALTSTTSAQKLFNWSAAGAVAITEGVWEFDCLFSLTGMSSTTGNAQFQLIGGGTAGLGSFAMASYGIDNNNPANSGTLTGSYAAGPPVSNPSIQTEGTGTGMWSHIRGVFTCTSAGTLIPSVALVTAAAATVGTGSYFKAVKLGAGTTLPIGTWT
jgi:hypothetical protein